MAEPTFGKKLPRRSLLAGGAAVSGISAVGAFPNPATGADDDVRIAALSARYRRANAALIDWIDATERRYGPLAYQNRPECRSRHDELAALERLATEALAQARPGGLEGLVLKLRPAFYCDTLYDAEPDCNAELLIAALHDLERLAGYI